MVIRKLNLNLGCPSRTVVTKGRGAGFLSDPETLQFFFDEVFREIKIKISVKTRIGLEHAEEFQDLLSVYNQFPFEELIIHPRVQCMYYNGTPDMETFAYACQNSKTVSVTMEICSEKQVLKDSGSSIQKFRQ